MKFYKKGIFLGKNLLKKLFCKKRKVIFSVSLIFLLLIILILVGFTTEGLSGLDGGKKKSSLTANEEKILSVEKVEVLSSKLLQDISSFGTISYSGKNDVTVQVEGILKKLHVKEGDKVHAGQVLAQVENIQLEIQRQQGETAVNSAEAGVNLAKTRLEEGRLAVESSLLNLEKLYLQLEHQQLELEEAQLELEKQKKLLELGGITEATYRSQQVALEGQRAAYEIACKELESQSLGFRDEDLLEQGIEPAQDQMLRRQQLIDLNTRTLTAELVSAQASLDSAKKNLKSIQELMSHLVILSPKSGVVAAKYFEQGEFLAENEKLLTIMDVNQVHAVFSIQEQDIGYFQTGSAVEVEVPALGLKTLAPVAEISPMADPQSGNFTLKSYLSNENEAIKPGMFVKCLLPRDSQQYPAIPESALVTEQGSKDENSWNGTVYLVYENRAIKQEVALLEKADGKVWISHGLTEGQWVVNNPSPFLKEGQRVE